MDKKNFTDEELKSWKIELKKDIRLCKERILSNRQKLDEIRIAEYRRKIDKAERQELTQICDMYGITLHHNKQIDKYTASINDENIAKHFGGVNPLNNMSILYYTANDILLDIKNKVLPILSNNAMEK